MRLLNCKSLKLEEFFNRPRPDRYAILSHRWQDEEIMFTDMCGETPPIGKAGYSKISACCAQAIEDGFDYVWIDTCCIDKSSSSELQEAINSMYRWYKQAGICYAFLFDIQAQDWELYNREVEDEIEQLTKLPTEDEIPSRLQGRSSLWESSWFSRGWTLQELIAPAEVQIYDSNWQRLGNKKSLCDDLSQITGIHRSVLEGKDPQDFSVAQRFSWAAQRQTTRSEDQAAFPIVQFAVRGL